MKIAILGSGVIQFEAIEYLYLHNIDIHVLSNVAPQFDIKYIVHFENIDIRQSEQVLNYCLLNKINYIYSVGSDFALLTSGYVSEKIGLPHFVSFNTIQLLQNKKLFRNFLKSKNISAIKFIIANSSTGLKDWNIFPCVLKPVDSQGQRGVSIVQSKEELLDLFPGSLSFSISKEVIIEEFIIGDEISVNAFVNNGEITHFYISDRITVDRTNSGIPLKHIIPSNIPSEIAELALEKCKMVITEAGIINGPVYFQMKYFSNKIEIIEVSPRLDGCHLWRLIKQFSECDLLDLTFKKLLGLNGNSNIKTRQNGKFCIEFKLQKPGELFNDIYEDSLYRIPYYKPGQTIKPTNGVLEKTIMHLKRV